MCALNIEKINTLIQKGKKISEIAKEYKVTRQAVYAHLTKAKKDKKKKKAKQKSTINKRNYNALIDWKVYNEGLIKRGEILLDFDIFKEWEEEISQLNKNKVGAPYQYPDSFILFLLRLKIMFQIDYRSLQGIENKLIVFIPKAKKSANYSTLQRRLKRLRIKLEIYQEGQNQQEIAGDASGLKTSNRGEYRMSKYREGVKKRYVKLHIAVNIKTRQVVSSIITGDEVSDNTQLKRLIKGAEKRGKIVKGLFDSGYDSEENYWYLKERNILWGIKPRATLTGGRLREEIRKVKREIQRSKKGEKITKLKKRLVRLEEMKEYQSNEKKWKEKYGYGYRWRSEGRYSVFKRIFGDHVFSKDMESIKNEVQLKVNMMNQFTSFLIKAYKFDNINIE